MAKKHTINTLTADVDRRFRAVNQRLDTMQPQVAEMHDYIVRKEGFEAGQVATYKKDGSVNISKDAWQLIVKLVLFLAAVAGITKLQ